MAQKVLLKDVNKNEILPITRGELVLDSSGKQALHSDEFLATTSQPGLMSKEDKYKIDNISISTLEITDLLPNGKKIATVSVGSTSYNILAPASYNWDEIIDKPTKLSQFTDDVVAGKYLPLTGGTIYGTASTILSINRIGGNNPLIAFHSDGTLVGFLGIDTDSTPCYVDPVNYGKYVLLHSGNYSDLLAGGAINGSIKATSFIGNLTGNADSATKLQTPRTIWGQSFDGTGDITTTLHITKKEEGSYNEGIRINNIGGYSSVWFNTINKQGYDAGMWGITAMPGGNLRFRGGKSNLADLMVITQDGNVGICTATPTTKLEVAGDVLSTGYYLKEASTNTPQNMFGWYIWSNTVQFTKRDTSNKYIKELLGINLTTETTTVTGSFNVSGNSSITGSVSATGPIVSNTYHQIYNSGSYVNCAASRTGAIVIQLPITSSQYDMINMEIAVYEYESAAASKIIVGGHPWDSKWYNYSCSIIGGYNKGVRLGVYGGKYCIILGNSSTVWQYPGVFVTHIGTVYDTYSNAYANKCTLSLVTSESGFSALVTPTNVVKATSGYATSAGYTTRLYANSTGDLLTYPGDYSLSYSRFQSNASNIFPVSNNANGCITAHLHNGNYFAQIGLSSNGRMYYRTMMAQALDSGVAWKTVAWTSDIPTVTDYYWANVQVSASSNAYTTPQFGSVTIYDGTNSCLYLKTTTAGSYAYLAAYNTGGQYGADVVLHSGSAMVLGAGESAASMYSNNVDSLQGSENLYLTADSAVKIFTNCDAIANRKHAATFNTDGSFRAYGRIYANEWIQFDNATGLYWPDTYGAHFYPNATSTYGQFQLLGTKNSYSGIHFGASKNYLTVMSTDTHHGLYCETYGWEFYFNRSNSYIGLRSSSTPYPISMSGDSYTTGWSRADSGFYVEGTGVHYTSQGSVGEIDMTSNNEFLWGSSSADLYFNYRTVSRGTTVTNYIWNAGSSSSYASHVLGNLYVKNVTLSTTLPTYDNAPVQFKSTANNNDASNSRYQPWISGKDSVNSYGYGITVSTGIYRDPGYSSGGYYIGCGWDGNANSAMWKFSRNGYLYGNFSGYLSGTAYSADAIKDSNNGTRITACYSTGGFSSNPSWLAAWNGYHLTYVSPGVLSVNYANSAGNADTLDGLHWTSFARWYGDASTDSTASDVTSTSTADFFAKIHATSGLFNSRFGAMRGSWWYVGNTQLNTGVGTLEMAGTAVLNLGSYADTNDTYKSLLFLDQGGRLWSYTANETAVKQWSRYVKTTDKIANASWADGASTVTVNDSNANSTYRMVWHSGNTLYGTGGIYCNPSIDYMYANSFNCGDWFRSSGNTGWYNPTYECHVYPNNLSTYGGLILRGIKNGYHGVLLGPGSGYMNLMDNGTDKGAYQEGWNWIWYYNKSNGGVSIRTSSITKDFNVSGTSYLSGKTWIGGTAGNETLNVNGWVGTTGDTGWYNSTYAGGMYMLDTTWVRIYNGKKFYVSNSSSDAIHSAGGVYVAGAVHAYANYLKSTYSGCTVTIGSQNSGWCHYETTAPAHWFNVPVYAAGGFFEYSDETLKDFHNDIQVDFEKLKTIPKKYFNFKSTPNKIEIGTSAQAVQKIYPEFVHKNADDTLGVDYGKLSVLALKGIDELYDMILELRAENRQLREQIQQLQK